MKLVIALLVCCQVLTVFSFCGDRRQNTEIFRSAVRGAEWLKQQQKSDGSWGDLHTTGSALFTLHLAGMQPLNKSAAIEYMRASLRCENDKLHQSYPLGQLAHAIDGIQALCQDPRDFADHNWVQRIKEEIAQFPKPDFDNYFQYSIAVTVLCNNLEEIPLDVINQLVKDEHGNISPLSLGKDDDALSLRILALNCIHNTQSRVVAQRRHKIYSALQKKAQSLMTRKDEDSLIKSGNQHTLALFVQAMLAADKNNHKWKCSGVMKKLLSYQEKDGSFGTILANIQVIPALIGALPSDMRSMTCKDDDTTPEEKSGLMIHTCIKVDLGDVKKSPEQVNIQVPQGTTAYQGLEMAAKLNNCYKFDALKTTFGHMITSICGVAHDTVNKSYWMLHDGEKSADVGVDQLELSEGKCAVLKYTKM